MCDCLVVVKAMFGRQKMFGLQKTLLVTWIRTGASNFTAKPQKESYLVAYYQVIYGYRWLTMGGANMF